MDDRSPSPRITLPVVVLAIVTAASAASAESVQDIVSARVAAQLSGELGILGVTVPDSVAALDLRPSEVNVTFRRAPRLGVVSVLVSIERGAKPKKVWARVRFGRRAKVLVAARGLTAGQAIKPGDLTRADRVVARQQGWELTAKSLAGSKVLATATRGTIIDGTIVQEPAPLARGTSLRVVVRIGRLQVATRGILERQARPGAIALVRLETNKRIVRARIVSRAKAVVVPASSTKRRPR